jgi:hypothetical protein
MFNSFVRLEMMCMNLQYRKYGNKQKNIEKKLVGFLKATDEKSRLRIRSWIHTYRFPINYLFLLVPYPEGNHSRSTTSCLNCLFSSV